MHRQGFTQLFTKFSYIHPRAITIKPQKFDPFWLSGLVGEVTGYTNKQQQQKRIENYNKIITNT